MAATGNGKVLLEARGIVKDFPGQRALDKVDFDVRRGEVHALIGENGAGKSTLIKILAGAYRQDEGDIVMDGEKKDISNSGDSQALGLSFIHQDLNIVPHLSVAEISSLEDIQEAILVLCGSQRWWKWRNAFQKR